MIGGMVGFALSNGIGSVDDFTLKSWDGSGFNVTEHSDSFTIDGNGRSANDPAYDLAGNMTFDGTQQFTFDGWNRMVSVAHAYRNGSGTLSSGQASVTMTYDGKGRRVKKTVTNSGQWDSTFKYYYDNDSLVETRNGSDQTVKQHVWGTRYIDELVQLSTVVTDFEQQNPYTYTHYWACQDANYNVLGLVNSSAVLKERYEYKPYGERFVFFNPGTNDVGLYAPTQASRRVNANSVDQPYGLCDVGHQGLVHDEEVGLVYNRARALHPTLARFAQRDPLESVDSPNQFLYLRSSPLRSFDPAGLCGCTPDFSDPQDRGHSTPTQPRYFCTAEQGTLVRTGDYNNVFLGEQFDDRVPQCLKCNPTGCDGCKIIHQDELHQGQNGSYFTAVFDCLCAEEETPDDWEDW
jgi:RHS repeat-associated protein